MIQEIELSKLRPWANNPRPNQSDEGLGEMEASLSSEQGQLQNLIAVPDVSEKGAFIVIAGNRRLGAFESLMTKGKVKADHKIMVDVRDLDIDSAEVLMISLAENVMREQMDPIDEYIAMANLIKKKVSEAAIAAVFGYKTRTVRQRLALGRLPSEAHAILRDKTRDLDWGRALTIADKATQKKICDDVGSNPAAWRNGDEIRRHLTSEAIPQDHALFDIKDYKGRIIYDMFGSNSLSDRAEFWELQNVAIEALRTKLDGEGWASVEVSLKPIDLWAYQTTTEKSEGKCIIEVIPNGKVTVHEGLRVDAFLDTLETDGDIIDSLLDEEVVSDAFVPLTKPVLAYASALRSAFVQTHIAASFRKSLEITVAGLIGHPEIGIRGQDYKPNIPSANRTADVFRDMDEIVRQIRETLEDAGIDRTDSILPALARLSDDELQTLFSQLVATKIGQSNANSLDVKETSLLNVMADHFQIDLRKGWTPDVGFFETMKSSDLRRIAGNLLDSWHQKGLATANRDNILVMLEEAFLDGRNKKSTMDAPDRLVLNEWVPGVLAFPAYNEAERAAAEVVETVNGESPFADEDPDGAVFDA